MAGRSTDHVLCCTFCHRTEAEVAKLIAGPGVYICGGCVELCNAILRDDAAALPDGSELDDAALLARLAPAAATVRSAEHAVHELVGRLRERGVSWARIGEGLGVSRQAAWERFSGEE